MELPAGRTHPWSAVGKPESIWEEAEAWILQTHKTSAFPQREGFFLVFIFFETPGVRKNLYIGQAEETGSMTEEDRLRVVPRSLKGGTFHTLS